MLLERIGEPLRQAELATPAPGSGQVLIHVHACAVCRTDLHVIDGELTQPKLPLIPGHEIVGTVVELGESVSRFKTGDRVGVPWLGLDMRPMFLLPEWPGKSLRLGRIYRLHARRRICGIYGR